MLGTLYGKIFAFCYNCAYNLLRVDILPVCPILILTLFGISIEVESKLQVQLKYNYSYNRVEKAE